MRVVVHRRGVPAAAKVGEDALGQQVPEAAAILLRSEGRTVHARWFWTRGLTKAVLLAKHCTRMRPGTLQAVGYYVRYVHHATFVKP